MPPAWQCSRSISFNTASTRPSLSQRSMLRGSFNRAAVVMACTGRCQRQQVRCNWAAI